MTNTNPLGWPADPHLCEAMWRGDTTRLFALANCRCCCDEHTYRNCPARAWYGCKGSFTHLEDPEAWAAFYHRVYGMSEETFFFNTYA